MFALILISITGIVQLGHGKTEFFTFENSETDVSVIALSFYSGLFSYTGWNYLNFIIEEMKVRLSPAHQPPHHRHLIPPQNPVRDLPRAIAISCTIVVIIYFFTIVSFHTTLSVSEVLGSEAVAVTFSNRLYGSMAWVMSLFVACSTFGGVNGTLLTASRLFMVGAREGQMRALLTCIHVRRATPVPSVIALTLLCLLYLTSRLVRSDQTIS